MSSSTVPAPISVEEYSGKRVILVHSVPGSTDAVETEGTVQSANALGVLIKPKGKTTLELVETDSIEDIRLAPIPETDSSPRKIKTKRLKEVALGLARTHLLDRHGYTLESVNALDEEEAFKLHASIDHEVLGHFHADPEVTEAEAAVEAAASA